MPGGAALMRPRAQGKSGGKTSPKFALRLMHGRERAFGRRAVRCAHVFARPQGRPPRASASLKLAPLGAGKKWLIRIAKGVPMNLRGPSRVKRARARE
ncbi:MAG: hypothetical protein CSA76_07170 [Spirochaetales bacterium]|nr:MAG: hypothetical protein CSA76_07170 [Spirochaetales bacterium]